MMALIEGIDFSTTCRHIPQVDKQLDSLVIPGGLLGGNQIFDFEPSLIFLFYETIQVLFASSRPIPFSPRFLRSGHFRGNALFFSGERLCCRQQLAGGSPSHLSGMILRRCGRLLLFSILKPQLGAQVRIIVEKAEDQRIFFRFRKCSDPCIEIGPVIDTCRCSVRLRLESKAPPSARSNSCLSFRYCRILHPETRERKGGSH